MFLQKYCKTIKCQAQTMIQFELVILYIFNNFNNFFTDIKNILFKRILRK